MNEIVNGRRRVSPSTQFFGTSSDFWMNLQLRWDLYHAQKAEADVLKKLPRYSGGRGSKAPA